MSRRPPEDRVVRLAAGRAEEGAMSGDGSGDGSGETGLRMRPARVRDEVRALEDFRVWLRPESFAPVLLSRLLRWSGSDETVDPGWVERLDRRDLETLERLFLDLNAYPGPGSPGSPGSPEEEEA